MRELPSVHSASLAAALERWDIRRTQSESVRNFYKAAPGGVPTQVAFSQDRRFEDLDTDRATGCIRDCRARLLQGRRSRGAPRQYRASTAAS